MKYVFENHMYAPELNKIHRVLKDGTVVSRRATIGTGIAARPALSLVEWRKGNRARQGHGVVIKATYRDPAHARYSRTYSGRVNSVADVLAVYKRLKAYHCLPNVEFTVKYLNIV